MEITENKKFYSHAAISITTFFGGPLAAGILIRQNYLNIDKDEQGRNALILGIISTVLIFTGIFMLPDKIFEAIPNTLIPTLYTAIIYFIVEKTQGNLLTTHKEKGGEFYSGWKAAKIGLLSLIAIFIGIFLSGFIMGDLSKEADFDAESYDNGLSTFFENETASLKILQSFSNNNIDYLKEEVKKSIVLWEENKSIINELNQIKNLPNELLVQNEKLLTYCELRIEHFQLISKSLDEETEEYTEQIKSIGKQIEKILKDIEP